MFTVMFAIRAPPAGSRTGSSSTKRPDRASAVRVRFIPAPTCATTCLPPSADHRLALKQTQNAPVLAGAFCVVWRAPGSAQGGTHPLLEAFVGVLAQHGFPLGQRGAPHPPAVGPLPR